MSTTSTSTSTRAIDVLAEAEYRVMAAASLAMSVAEHVATTPASSTALTQWSFISCGLLLPTWRNMSGHSRSSVGPPMACNTPAGSLRVPRKVERCRAGSDVAGAQAFSLSSTSRRVMRALVVRHFGTRFRLAPLPKHIDYPKRDVVSRDGADARMFDAQSDTADEQAFAERCEGDRHHFRFIVSPEDAAQLTDLRAFTRDLMGGDGQDLMISRPTSAAASATGPPSARCWSSDREASWRSERPWRRLSARRFAKQ